MKRQRRGGQSFFRLAKGGGGWDLNFLLRSLEGGL